MLTKDKLKDQRIWILGAGQSLNSHNLELLRDENVILVNRVVELVTKKEHTFNKFCWCWNDFHYLPDIALLNNIPFNNAVVGIEINMRKAWMLQWANYKALMDRFTNFVPFDCSKVVTDGFFSYDVTDRTYCGWTVVIDLALPLAMWWGCKNIYLIGCDTSHTPHFNRDNNYANVNQIELTKLGYERVRHVADLDGYNIYNAGVGGKLEVFPRVNYEEVLNNKS